MRISDWSSDVCSSDLAPRIMVERRARHAEFARDILERRLAKAKIAEYVRRGAQHLDAAVAEAVLGPAARLADGSCRHGVSVAMTCGLRTRGARPWSDAPPSAPPARILRPPPRPYH